MKIAIVDYGVGNIYSISNALDRIGCQSYLISSAKDFNSENFEGMILPGVGAFPAAMNLLKSKNLDKLVKDFSSSGKPLIGICLGMQLLMDYSCEFGNTEGLGLVAGHVDSFKSSEKFDTSYKVPNIGWSTVNTKDTNFDNGKFYFVHSYFVTAENSEDVLFESVYGGLKFCSGLKKNNIYGLQFHPEKSGSNGLRLLKEILVKMN